MRLFLRFEHVSSSRPVLLAMEIGRRTPPDMEIGRRKGEIIVHSIDGFLSYVRKMSMQLQDSTRLCRNYYYLNLSNQWRPLTLDVLIVLKNVEIVNVVLMFHVSLNWKSPIWFLIILKLKTSNACVHIFAAESIWPYAPASG